MKKVIFFTSHGVEVGLEEGYCQEFFARILERIPTIYQDYIVPYAFNWNVLVKDRQEQTYEIESDLGASALRYFAVMIACDILWYKSSKNPNCGIDIFGQIHNKFETELDLLVKKHGEAVIVACGHSWGSQIALDHCFETKHKITGLITMGSPISKVSGMFPDWGHLPKEGLSFWLNFYANRDLVASSFKKHPSKDFRELIEDVRVRTWNPIRWTLVKQHTLYWTSPQIHQKIADRLVKEVLRINA